MAVSKVAKNITTPQLHPRMMTSILRQAYERTEWVFLKEAKQRKFSFLGLIRIWNSETTGRRNA